MTQRLLLVVLILALNASAADCERHIASDGPGARTIVLAGGDAWALFRQFLSEVEQRDLDVSLWRSEVQISRGGQTDTFTLGWMKAIFGDSAETEWKNLLSGQRAEINPRLLAEARSSRWDVICVGQIAGQETPPPAKVPPPAPASSEARLFFKTGVQYASSRDYANALKEFHAAEKIAPEFQDLQMNIGVTYLQMRDYARAAVHLTRAIDQDPKNAAAHYNMACLQARRGQRDRAIASLAIAQSNGMKLTPDLKRDPDLSSLRGRDDFEALFK